MKTEEEINYKLIPMSEITDEARKLSVAWCEASGINWIGDKHKLASDIMNYALQYHKAQQDSVNMFTEDKVNEILNDILVTKTVKLNPDSNSIVEYLQSLNK